MERLALQAQRISQSAKEVQLESRGPLAVVRLNRPKALNSINLAMVRSLTDQLPIINQHRVAWFEGEGKAFCAGGDVKVIFMPGSTPEQRCTFFREQFTLDYRVSQMDAVQISCWDGVTMGGGVGLTAYAPFIIATENTLFAMPQAKLGFFTDVGVNYVLSRLRSRIGYYLGMTGARLKGKQVVMAGLAHFFIPSAFLPQAKAQLEVSLKNSPGKDVKAVICEVLLKFNQRPQKMLLQNEGQIDKLFSLPSARAIYEACSSKDDDFHKRVAKMIEEQCPASVELIYRSINKAKNSTLRECFRLDYQMVQHIATDANMKEGVRCVLFDKGQTPHWQHSSLQELPEEAISHFFTPVAGSRPLDI